MKKIFLMLFVSSLFFISCNDSWDDHYSGNGDNKETELNQTIVEFLAENNEYSDFTEMLRKTGLYPELSKDQEITLWVVDNAQMQVSGIEENDTIRMEYHINNLPYLLTDLKDGIRIRSLNGIYFQISKQGEDLYVNNSEILNSYRLKDGVVHVISDLMKSRINMYDFLKQLDDDYSIIRDSIFYYDVKEFDKDKSIPIGVDKTGNTIYDSVFYTSNPLFTKAKFNSEFEQFTAFVPSNQVIEDCFVTLADSYAKMGKTLTQADTLLAFQWIKEAMFYKGVVNDFSVLDIKSAFDRIWRTSIQKVDENNFVELSNGKLYYMEKVKVPNNVLISRIKSLVEYWRYQEPANLYPSSDDLYTFINPLQKADGTYNIGTTDNTGVPTEASHLLTFYTTLDITGNAESNDEFSVEFPPLERYTNDAGEYKVRVMEVPTGEYNFYMGFRSSAHPYVDIYFNGKLIQEKVQASLSTPWNFDRVTETSKDRDPINGITKWDGLGGLVGVVNVEGDGTSSMASFRVKVKFNQLESMGALKRMQLYHWSLKPTENNY